MQQVDRDEAQSRLPELLNAALRGEEVYITGEGNVRVRLVPTPVRRGTPRFGSAKGMFTMSDDFDDPLPEFDEYTRRQFGSAKGIITISDNFDDPLPEFQEYMR